MFWLRVGCQTQLKCLGAARRLPEYASCSGSFEQCKIMQPGNYARICRKKTGCQTQLIRSRTALDTLEHAGELRGLMLGKAKQKTRTMRIKVRDDGFESGLPNPVVVANGKCRRLCSS